MPVEIATVQVGAAEHLFRTVGELEAREAIELRARRAGRVVSRHGEEGGRMQRGQVLVQLDAREAEAEVALGHAAVADAAARQRNADRIFTRLERLRGEGVASQQARDDAAAEQEQAAAALAVAEARLAVAEAALADTRIPAPFSGWLGRWRIDPGAFVQPGEVLGRLSNDDPLEIVFAVPERELARVAVGQPIRVEVTSHPGEEFVGAIRFVEPRVDPATRTTTVVGELPNPERRLRGGQFARIEVMLDREDAALLVPLEAVRTVGDRSIVFVVEGDRAEARTVAIGVRQGDQRQVRNGLRAGDVVVRNGHDRLAIEGTTAVAPVELEDGRPL